MLKYYLVQVQRDIFRMDVLFWDGSVRNVRDEEPEEHYICRLKWIGDSDWPEMSSM